jgi:hypothetical protein
VDDDLFELLGDRDFRVFAIWAPVFERKQAPRWLLSPARLIGDARAMPFWDGEQTVARWYTQYPGRGYRGKWPIAWNTYALYGPEAVLDRSEPPEPVGWGGRILDQKRPLLEELVGVLGETTVRKSA